MWIAHIGEVVVGYLVAELGDDHIVRVDQVWVTPEARELGFGDELLGSAIAGAREAGAVAVEGQALPGDRHTKNLYERAGIVARLITTYRLSSDQRPFHSGARFSMNAVSPSARSSDDITVRIASLVICLSVSSSS